MLTRQSTVIHARISVLSLLKIALLITIGFATNTPATLREPIIISRPRFTVESIPRRKSSVWSYRRWQQQNLRNLIHFYLVHEQCECGRKADILKHKELLKVDKDYIASETEYLATQKEGFRYMKRLPKRPTEKRRERLHGFFDEYRRLFRDCRQTPSRVGIDPTIVYNPDETKYNVIWSLYTQIEALWEDAEQHRATLIRKWPPLPRAAKRRLTGSQNMSQETASQQVETKEDPTPKLDNQFHMKGNAQYLSTDDMQPELLEERNEPYETQHAARTQGVQTGLYAQP